MSVAKSRLRVASLVALLAALLLSLTGSPTVAHAATLVPITGAGSTWSSNAMDEWIGNVNQYGIKVDFAATGSSDGRTQFKNGTVDFGVSEIPYGVTDNGTYEPPPSRSYAYMPIVAGGTSFMYQLHINGKLVSNLRLSGATLAGIFTGGITKWNDPAVTADNPGIVLPAEPIVPIVRSDGSGTTAQFTTWLSKTYPDVWNAYCAKAGRVTPCGVTSTYPTVSGYGFISQQLSTGVAGYITQSQSEGTIGYVEYSYALQANYPVVKMLNAAGYYTEPTADNVAVALTQAQINTDPSSPSYLTQVLDGVYSNPDPRAYPLSSYSYMIIPTAEQPPLTSDKGYTLGKFDYYFLCEGQRSMPDLGYSPLPVNLVQAALDQVKKIPGVAVENTNIASCNNPTFDPATGKNLLAETAPQPQSCDKQAVTMCPNHTGGAPDDTIVAGGAPTIPPAVVAVKPTKKPKPQPTVKPGVKTTGGPSAKPAPGNSPGAPGSTPTSPTGGTRSHPTGVPSPGASSAAGSSPPGAVTTSAEAGAGQKAGRQAGQPTEQPGSDPFVESAPSAPAAESGASAAPPAAAVPAVPIRAQTVAVGVGTGWSVQDTLWVLAVVAFLLVTLLPPLLAARLRRKAP